MGDLKHMGGLKQARRWQAEGGCAEAENSGGGRKGELITFSFRCVAT